METERHLRFAVLALQEGLIDAEQFAEACQCWSANPEGSLADVLVEKFELRADAVAEVDKLLIEQDAARAAGQSSAKPVACNFLRPLSRTVALGPAGNGNGAAPGVSFAAVEQRYARQKVHGAGGMGRVWLAHDTQLNRHVALKELHPDLASDAPLAARFIQEARITGRLEHPGIVPVYEFAWNPETNQPFYTMRFVRGRTLVEAAQAFHERRANGASDPLEFVALLTAFVAVCNTVAYAHSHRILHRDLKGENVLLGDFGEVVLLDWGLAKALDDAEEEHAVAPVQRLTEANRTIQGDVLGTPGYMSPEQAAGRLDQLTERTDVYGLGAILYEILTGNPPNAGGTTLEQLANAQHGELVPPRDVWPEAPLGLEAACLRALAKNPAFRFPSAADLAHEVQSWQETQRRAAEEALQRQTDILQSILNSMGEGVIVADGEGKLLHINPAAERIFGCQATGTTFGDAPEHVEVCLADRVTSCPHDRRPMTMALQGSEVDDLELFVKPADSPDGLWASASARPLRDQRGAVQGGLVVLRDISERKRAEEALRHSQERFDLAVQGSQDGLWDWCLHTGEIYYSPRWKAIIGYAEDELTPTIEEWSDRLHPDEKERVLAANYAHINGETPHYEYEYRLRHKDGSYRWILARGVALRDAAGTAYRMAGSHVDVTSRRESEQALRESENRYDAVIASLQVGVTIRDADGRLRGFNPSAQRILGLSADAIGGTALFDARWQAIREDGTPFPLECCPSAATLRTCQGCRDVVMGLRKPDGDVAWLTINAQPLFRNGDATPYAVAASIEDITDRKRCEQTLQETTEALRRCQEELNRLTAGEWSAAGVSGEAS
ncbi:MAG: PAS domain S-box protein [Planctomycetia bacterium]|nr:PAS domain S-box protein [Planctomycetia bacterium]